ncbi:MAG: acyl-CoA dehydrogenase, partial [Myxococcota bacterium]
FEAAMDIQDHLQSLALAHVEAHVFGCFRAAVERQPAGPEREALQTLCALHGVSTLAQHAGWFLENGYVEAAKARALRRLVTRLCAEVRPLAVPLVDAFGIPDAVLSAPIAFEGYADQA